METENVKRVKLKSNLSKTASSVEIMADGSLVAEFFDFSDAAEGAFGNDVAFLITVSAADKDMLLLHLMQDHFQSWFRIKEWLQAHEVPFKESFDSQA